ncbi:hypothetical protein AGMMS49965_23940 [Bacteroidia bacterium]|nr:hypothetical protein AGMMS49965_23940 [Bacteroidia bacterium]
MSPVSEKSVSRKNGGVNLIGRDLEQYEKDAAELKKGLSQPEIAKINHILKRIENVSKYNGGKYKFTDIYTKDEINKFIRMHDGVISSKVDDYYQYKNYKLRVDLFEPSIFTDEYEISKLKTADKIRGHKELSLLDIGAYNGDSTLILRNHFPNNPIYAFEAVPDFCNTINETMKLNDIQNVIPVNLALGDKEGRVPIKYGKFTGTTQMNTLDNFVNNNNIRVGLIKTDIEGAEWALLQGAIQTIREQKPTLIISIYHNYNDFFKIKPLIDSWGLGYNFTFTDSCYGKYPIHEITLNCEVM